jgi:hypothetical protein
MALAAAMRRRDFIKGIGGTAGAWPLAARAQDAKMLVIIGLLHNSSLESVRDSIPAFHQGIGQLSGESMR